MFGSWIPATNVWQGQADARISRSRQQSAALDQTTERASDQQTITVASKIPDREYYRRLLGFASGLHGHLQFA